MSLTAAVRAAFAWLKRAALRPQRLRRALLWGALLALLGVAQSLLVALTLNFESERAQDEAANVASATAAELRRSLTGSVQTLQALQALAMEDGQPPAWHAGATALLQQRQALVRVEERDNRLAVSTAVDSRFAPPLFALLTRRELGLEAELACTAARRATAPVFSRSYFVPLPQGLGLEVIDLCIPLQRSGAAAGFLVGSFALAPLLETVVSPTEARKHEFSIVEGDGTRLARAGAVRGARVYVADRVVDLPGTPLLLRADSVSGRPSLIPNLATALVLGLSLALFAVVLALARDVRRRAQAERALAEALAFRKAMEDSLSTGLRARDLQGRLTYANPAFCAMVGYSADELQVVADLRPTPGSPPPQLTQASQAYWPPERVEQYQQRQQQRQQQHLAGGLLMGVGAQQVARESREGFETLYMRKNGERFPVMIYEAPLVDGQGRHTGWMSAVLDLSVQRRMEEVARQQQDRLQATARLATVGEMASLLSHELNQPLAAIASYASGSLNLLLEADASTPGLLKQGLQRISEQAERAGRVIQSVHNFVRRREHQHETLSVHLLLEAVLPLARLQARKSGTRIEVDLGSDSDSAPAAGNAEPVATPPRPLRVRCDRTMVEQVLLLNLTRNGIQAMEGDTPLAQRVLTLRVRRGDERWIRFSVIDSGPGVPADVAARLFTPFFTTRAEGMGLGLSLCRTVIEQHGGTLDFEGGPQGLGTEFRFSLPAGRSAGSGGAPQTHESPTTPESPESPDTG